MLNYLFSLATGIIAYIFSRHYSNKSSSIDQINRLHSSIQKNADRLHKLTNKYYLEKNGNKNLEAANIKTSIKTLVSMINEMKKEAGYKKNDVDTKIIKLRQSITGGNFDSQSLIFPLLKTDPTLSKIENAFDDINKLSENIKNNKKIRFYMF